MDINQFFKIAESRGIDAINAIKKSNATNYTPQTNVTSVNLNYQPRVQVKPVTPMATIKPTPPRQSTGGFFSKPLSEQLGVPYAKEINTSVGNFISSFLMPKVGESDAYIENVRNIEKMNIPNEEKDNRIRKLSINTPDSQTGENVRRAATTAVAGGIQGIKNLPSALMTINKTLNPIERVPADVSGIYNLAFAKNEIERQKELDKQVGRFKNFTEAVFTPFQILGGFTPYGVGGNIFNQLVVRRGILNAYVSSMGIVPDENLQRKIDAGEATFSEVNNRYYIPIDKALEYNPNLTDEQINMLYSNNAKALGWEVADFLVNLLDPGLFISAKSAGGELGKINPGKERYGQIVDSIVKQDKATFETLTNQTLTEEQSRTFDELSTKLNGINEISNLTQKGVNDSDMGITNAQVTINNERARIDSLNKPIEPTPTGTKQGIDPKGTLSDAEFNKRYQERLEQQKEAARGKQGWVKDNWNKLTSSLDAWINDIENPGNFLATAVREIEKARGKSMEVSKNFEILFDELFSIQDFVSSYLNTSGFKQLLQDVKANAGANVAEFSAYLETRRNLALAEVGQKLDINTAEASRFVSSLDAKYGEFANRYYKIMNDFLRYTYESGLIDEATYNATLLNKDYTVFEKIFAEGQQPDFPQLMKRKTAGLGKQSIVQKMLSKFSEPVEDPLVASVNYITRGIYQIKKNEVGRAIIDSIRNGDFEKAGLEGFITVDAEKVKLRKLIKDEKDFIKNFIKKTTNKYRKDKLLARKLSQEIKMLQDLGEKINTKFNLIADREFVQNINRIISDKTEPILKLKEDIVNYIGNIEIETPEGNIPARDYINKFGNEVLNYANNQEVVNTLLKNKAEWLYDLMIASTENVNPELSVSNSNLNQRFKTRKEKLDYLNSLPAEDVRWMLESIYDMDSNKLNSLYKKTSSTKLKSMLSEIEKIKREQLSKDLYSLLFAMKPDKMLSIANNIKNKESKLYKMIKETENLQSRLLVESVIESMSRKSPEEVQRIRNLLTKKEPKLREIIDGLIEKQNALDDATGYKKYLAEQEKLNQDLSSKGYKTIQAIRDGITETAVVDARIADALETTNNPSWVNYALNLLRPTTQIVKLGAITFNPSKILSLFIQDQGVAAIQSERPFQTSAFNVPALGRALLGAYGSTEIGRKFFKTGELDAVKMYDEWVSNGASQADLTFLNSKENTSDWVKSGGKNKISFKYALDNLGDLLSRSDQVVRLQTYEAMKDLYLSQGLSEADAQRKAAYDARNITINWSRRSETLRALDIIKPFFAAGIKSAAAFRKAFKKNPKKAIAVYGITTVLPYIATLIWNNSDEEKRKYAKKIPKDIWDKNLVFMLDPKFGVDENDNPYYITIPMDQNSMAQLAGYRKLINGMYQGMPGEVMDGFSDWFLSVSGIRVPTSIKQGRQEYLGGLNPILGSAVEIGLNKNAYTGQEIIPQELQKKYASQQVTDKTSELAKLVNQITRGQGKEGISPLYVDYFINRYFSTAGQYALREIDNAITYLKGNPTKEDAKKPGKNMGETFVKSFVKNDYSQEQTNLWEQKTEEDKKKSETNDAIKSALISGDIDAAIKAADGQVTKAQFRALENSVQNEKASENLTKTQKTLYNFSNDYLETVKKTNPELTNDVNTVLDLKKGISKLPNINTSSFNFKSTGTGGGGITVQAPKGVKIGKISKPKKLAMPKPKKLKIKKAAKPKKIKIAKLKPIKRTRNI